MLLFGSRQALGLALQPYAAKEPNKEVFCEYRKPDQTIGLYSGRPRYPERVRDDERSTLMVETRRPAWRV